MCKGRPEYNHLKNSLLLGFYPKKGIFVPIGSS
jgi:hypothetical protein